MHTANALYVGYSHHCARQFPGNLRAPQTLEVSILAGPDGLQFEMAVVTAGCPAGHSLGSETDAHIWPVGEG